MDGFAFLWLLFNTNWGKTLLGIFIVLIIVIGLGWWTVPVIAVLLTLPIFLDLFNGIKVTKQDIRIGVGLLVFAVLFSLGIIFFKDISRWYRHLSHKPKPVSEEMVTDTCSAEPDTIIVDPIEIDSFGPLY